jgi:pimeloyl-ACP methyl ester carboxylesterase
MAGVVVVNGSGFLDYNPFTRAFCALMGRPSVISRLSPLFARGYMAPQTPQDRDIIAKVRARVRTPDGARTAAALWRSFPNPANDLRGKAAEITAPVLITWGTRDITSPLRWGRAVHRGIAGSKLVALPAGHVVFSSLPDAWLAEVLPFLEAAQRESVSRP